MFSAMCGRYLMFLSFWVGIAQDCRGAVCEKPHLPGRGISLLQAASRNKSDRNTSAKATLMPNSSTESTVGDALKVAETLGNVTEDSLSGSLNDSTADSATPTQNLSSGNLGVNYSDVASDETVAVPSEPPYSIKNESKVMKVHPIKGATPLPEPVQVTAAMRDCIMGDWGAWSECLTDDANGYASSHQVRERSIVQPYLPGGQMCEPTMETRNCVMISAANTLVNLGE